MNYFAQYVFLPILRTQTNSSKDCSAIYDSFSRSIAIAISDMASSKLFDTVCNIPLTSDLFAQAIHPNEPLVAVGLLSGHVQMLRLPSVGDNAELASPKLVKKTNVHTADSLKSKSLLRRSSGNDAGIGMVDTQWRTKRHKTSCRALCFSPDGLELYSAGGDGIVKAASTETGQVEAKLALPRFEYVFLHRKT
jgi:WD repeat-containing protein 55